MKGAGVKGLGGVVLWLKGTKSMGVFFSPSFIAFVLVLSRPSHPNLCNLG